MSLLKPRMLRYTRGNLQALAKNAASIDRVRKVMHVSKVTARLRTGAGSKRGQFGGRPPRARN
jgi:hypothetical protein